MNTLAALHAYDALGLPLDRPHEGVAGIRLSPWRGEEIALPGGGFVVNDAYNANPDSMRAALEHLAERAGDRRRIAILGEMAELGDASEKYHREVGELAAELGIEVIGVGEPRARVRARRLGADAGRSARARSRADRAWRRRPRQGVARRRARRHRRRDRELRPSMIPVLIAGLIAMVAAVVIGPKFIELLRARNLGQQIRAEGPATHVVKQGTPTMGGLLIIASAVVPFLALSQYTAEGLTVLFIVLGCALIGFTDDYLKIRRRHSLGLPGRWKMVGLAVVTVVAALMLNESASFTTEVYVPVAGWTLDLSLGLLRLLFLVIAGTVNGANLTDGIDGLAAGVVVIMLLTFLAIAGIAWLRSGDPGARSDTLLDIATLAAALIGGTIGFLWYNAFPAEVHHGRHGLVRPRRRDRRVRDRHGHGDPAAAHRGHLRDRGALADHPGRQLQADGQARVPDRADPPPLRDEGVVGDEDHGALLDRLRDLLRLRVRALLSRLPAVRPAVR